jgi:hypothetical protein
MHIEPREVTVEELFDGYIDKSERGVIGYGGRLDIRPPYQREFIYKDAQRDAVIRTVVRGYPLNVMYWAARENGFEIIDGQQRTVSLCRYVAGDFAVKLGEDQPLRNFHNLQSDEQRIILDYPLTVYVCTGTDSQKLDWFKTINIAGEKLTHQELCNAVYHGSWVTDAKRWFSRTGCPAYTVGADYLVGSPIRQEYLATAIKWINHGVGDVENYMSVHQHDANANELWLYFQGVMAWIKATFPTQRREMRGIAWGPLHARFAAVPLDSATLEVRVEALMGDDDVTNKRGIYEYVLDGGEHHLNIRAFTPAQKRGAFERQGGVCAVCKRQFAITEMEADHVTPWHEGGKTSSDNCQVLCREDNRRKGGR